MNRRCFGGVKLLLLRAELPVLNQSRCLAQLSKNIEVTPHHSHVCRLPKFCAIFTYRCNYTSSPPTYLSVERSDYLKKKLRDGITTEFDHLQTVDSVIENLLETDAASTWKGVNQSTDSVSQSTIFPNQKKELNDNAESVMSQPMENDVMFNKIFDLGEHTPENFAASESRKFVHDSFVRKRTGKDDITMKVEDLEPNGSDLIRSPAEEEDLSWLVKDQKVPVLRGIRSDICRHLFLTNFSTHSGSIIRHKVRDSFERNLNASDFATLASSIYNYDEYLSLDSVSLILQAKPGGLSLVDPETQKEHLRILTELIVEKFDPEYLIIFSPLIPENLSGFIIDGDETKTKIMEVIRVIKEFCDQRTISKTKLVHHSLQDALSVNGSVSQKLFFQPDNSYDFNTYGYSTLGNILNIVTKSLFPRDIKNVELELEPQFRSNRRPYFPSSETISTFGSNDNAGHDYRNDYRRPSNRYRNYNRYQNSNDDEWFSDSYPDTEKRSYRPPGRGYRGGEHLENKFEGHSRYGAKSRFSKANENFKEHLRNKEKDRTVDFGESYSSESVGNDSRVDPYHRGYKLVQKSRYGDKTEFAGKYKVNYTNDDRLRPRTPYKLDRDKDSYVFLDIDE